MRWGLGSKESTLHTSRLDQHSFQVVQLGPAGQDSQAWETLRSSGSLERVVSNHDSYPDCIQNFDAPNNPYVTRLACAPRKTFPSAAIGFAK